MKILHITPTFYPASYWGGPIYSTYDLCNELASKKDITLYVLTTDSAGPKLTETIKYKEFPMVYPVGYKVYFCRRCFSLSFSPGMLLRLWPMIRDADVVHLTAVYSSPTIPTLLICGILNKPVVWSPRGSLQRWEKTTRPLAKRVWEYICNLLIRPDRCILHVTSTQEAVASNQRIPNAEIKVIPNGVDIPDVLPERTWKSGGRLRLLYLGRLHPIKGIENLLEALKQLGKESISLDIYGTGDGDYCNSLDEMVKSLNLSNDVLFKGHLDSKDKLTAFMSYDVCVVPSYSENFGMVVAESLAHGVPVIASKGTPWKDIEKYDCGYWVDNTPESLASSIKRLFSVNLLEMGMNGRKWMQAEYNWRYIGGQMNELYKDILL
jgi:glycosyltransferase involved in cell wall biosynthesis